jgi:uncharacterized protein HemX
VILAKEKPRKNTRCRFVLLSPDQSKKLGLIVAVALISGLGLTHFFHVRIVALRAKVHQLQTSNTVITDTNNRMEADGAHASSKTQVVALAQRKLKLFEPDRGQVRRM